MYERYKTKFDALNEANYEFLGIEIRKQDSKKRKTYLHLLHKKCNSDYYVEQYKFFAGCRCPCDKGVRISLNRSKSHDQFMREVNNCYGTNFAILSKYVNSKVKVKVQHNICENEFMINPASFLLGNGCPICNMKISGRLRSKKHNQFVEQVFELVGKEYSILTEYKQNKSKIRICHNVCHYEYDVCPSNFLRGNRCPNCSSSKGEKKIKDALDKANINYMQQYRIPECKNIRVLLFDFAIMNKSDKLVFLIEYDGPHHYRNNNYFTRNNKNFTFGNLEYVQHNDSIKNDYCEKNGIELFRIPYWEFNNIEKILSEKLHNQVTHKICG